MQQSNYRGGGGQRYNGGAKTALTGQTGGLAPAANAPDRKFIDPGSAMVRELTEIRPYFSENSYNDPQLALSIGPSKIFQRLLPLPFSRAARPFPEMSFTTRHCHTCINKSRCPINVVRWTPDGRRLVSGASSGDLTIWSSLGFMNESTIGAHATAIRALEWSKTGDFMLSGDNDGAIKIFNPQFGLQKESETAHTSSVRGLSFSPTDSKFASCSDDLSVKIWDFDTLKEERKLNGHGFDVKSVSWHPFKALVLSGGRDNLVKLWDPRASDEVLTISGHKKSVSLVSWNPHNGNWFCSTSRDRSVRIYDIRMLGAANRRANAGGGASSESGDRALHVLTAHSSEVYAAAWHPEHEDLLATGGYDGSLLFWLIKSRVDDADAVTPVEEALARGANGAANLSERSCEEPRVQASVPAAHENAIWTMDWHPTGHMLCTGSNDHTCKFWSRMRPGATVDDYYGGFQRDISEVDILRELNLLPPVSPLEEELVKRRLAEQELDTEKEGKENCGPYSEAIELLGSVKIPGVGVVETECSTKHIGPILMPIEAARKPVYLPEIAEATIANFTTDLIETLERGKLLSAEVGGVRANHEVAAVSSGSDRQGGGVKRNFESGPGGDASQARASTDISNLPGTRLCGTVKHWNDKGYGFIKPDASGMEDLYAHATDIVDGFGSGGEQKLDRGDRVVFRHEVGENKVTGKAQVKAKEIVCARYYVEAGISLPSDNSGDSSTPANGSGNPQSAAPIPNQSFGQQQQPHGAQPMHGNHQRPHNNNMGQPPPGHMGQPPPGHMGQPPPGHMGQPPPGHMGQPPPGHMGQPPPGHMGQPPPGHMGQPPPGHMGQPPPGHMGQPPPGHMGQPPQQHQFQQGHMGAPPQQHQFQQGFNGNPPPMTADRKHHILSILQKAQGSSNPAEISQALAQYGISHDELAQVMAHDQGSGNY